MERFGDRLVRLRHERVVTQKQVAEELMIPYSLFTYYESGRGYPSCDKLELLADFFGVTMDWLWKGDQ